MFEEAPQFFETPHSSFELPQVTLWLTRSMQGDALGEWKLERVLTTSTGFNLSIAYRKDEAFEDIIQGAVCASLSNYLPKTEEMNVVTVFDYWLELPSIILNRLTITGQALVNGAQRVIVTFQRVVGDIGQLFREGRAPDMLQSTGNDIALRVLNDLVIPLLNLVQLEPEAAEKFADKSIDAWLKRLRSNKDEIAFYATLITRYLSYRDRARPEPVLVSK